MGGEYPKGRDIPIGYSPHGGDIPRIYIPF